jgi:hypothetical protein
MQSEVEGGVRMTRTIQLIQLLHATLLCNPELTTITQGDTKTERYGKRKFKDVLDSLNPIMTLIERNLPEDMVEALYDEQRNTQILLDAVLDMNPEQTIEVIKAFKESKLIK